MVVGENRVPVARRPRGVEVVGSGENRVLGVVWIRNTVAAGVDALAVPGFRHELHPPLCPSR